MKETKVASRVELCRECLALRGPCFDTFSHCERVQRCSCEAKEPLWKGYDYNTAIELCRCCSRATLPSGSRWSPFFCDPCKEHVLAYNRMAGFTVIPLGRHSAMNGLSLSGDDAKSAVARGAFEADLASFFTRIERLSKWHRDCVRAVVESIPGKDAVPLETYLEHARTKDESPAAFDELVLALTTPPPSPEITRR